MQIVGRDQRQLELSRYPQQILADPALDRDAVVHQFHVVVAGAEQISKLRSTGNSVVVATQPEVGLHLSARAAGGADQSGRVPGKQLAIDPRLVEVTLQRGQRRSEEHTSELQSQSNLVCRLLLEK